MDTEEFVFKAITWNVEEEKDKTIIYVSGVDSESITYHAKIFNFLPYVYLELKSDKNVANYLFNDFVQKFYAVQYTYCTKYLLYGKEKIKCMKIFFSTNSRCKKFSNVFYDRQFYTTVNGLTVDNLKVHEQNVDILLKFSSIYDINFSDWILIVGMRCKTKNFSSSDVCIYSYCNNISCISHYNKSIFPKYVSFDIECYTESKHFSIPNAEIEGDEIFQISLVSGYISQEIEQTDCYLISLFDPIVDENNYLYYDEDDPNKKKVKTIKCKNEKELLLEFAYMINHINPDIFIGYNTLAFDWRYIIIRSKYIHNIENIIFDIGKISGILCEEKIIKWMSSAVGEQSYHYLNVIGRMNIDVFVEIGKNYKLQSNSLKYVSQYFLSGESKDDMSFRQMCDIIRLYKSTGKNISIYDEFTNPSGIELRYSTGYTEIMRQKLLSCTSIKNRKRIIAEGISKIGVYCVQDSVLSVKLMNKLDLYNVLTEFSIISRIPINYIQTRGQHIRVFALVYYTCQCMDIIINYTGKESDYSTYKGATVLTAIAGKYEKVAVFDFASLYPSIIISYNICYTTIVYDEKIPDDECNVIIWEESNVEFKYRFKKIKIGEDGSISNQGVLPKLLKDLLDKRKEVKNKLKNLSDDFQLEIKVCNSKQLAIKTVANSVYGVMGLTVGNIPFLIGAACVTAQGRYLINITCTYILSNIPYSNIIYGDTDSCMITIDNIEILDLFEICKQLVKDITKYVKSIICGCEYGMYYDYISVKLEFEKIFDIFILFSKKRYIGREAKESGEIGKLEMKGISTVRRDNCQYLKDIYIEMVDAIVAGEDKSFVINILIKWIYRLFCREINTESLVIRKGIKSLELYTKHRNIGGKLIFINKYGEELSDIIGFNDPRIVWNAPNPPSHVMLAIKMANRGEIFNSNIKINCVILDIDSRLQGNKLEDYEYYVEHKQSLPGLDYIYYLQHIIDIPITELLNVIYRYREIQYHSTDEAVIDYLKMYKLKTSSVKRLVNYTIYKRHRYNIPLLFLNICLRWKSEYILIQLCKKYKTKYRFRRPTAYGANLRLNTKVFYGNDKCTIISKNAPMFNILFENGSTKYVNRHDIYPIYEIDGCVMKDIIIYRQNYKEVINEIKTSYKYNL